MTSDQLIFSCPIESYFPTPKDRIRSVNQIADVLVSQARVHEAAAQSLCRILGCDVRDVQVVFEFDSYQRNSDDYRGMVRVIHSRGAAGLRGDIAKTLKLNPKTPMGRISIALVMIAGAGLAFGIAQAIPATAQALLSSDGKGSSQSASHIAHSQIIQVAGDLKVDPSVVAKAIDDAMSSSDGIRTHAHRVARLAAHSGVKFAEGAEINPDHLKDYDFEEVEAEPETRIFMGTPLSIHSMNRSKSRGWSAIIPAVSSDPIRILVPDNVRKNPGAYGGLEMQADVTVYYTVTKEGRTVPSFAEVEHAVPNLYRQTDPDAPPAARQPE